jgi:hypothetical protein
VGQLHRSVELVTLGVQLLVECLGCAEGVDVLVELFHEVGVEESPLLVLLPELLILFLEGADFLFKHEFLLVFCAGVLGAKVLSLTVFLLIVGS